jgi:hypothetical protein
VRTFAYPLLFLAGLYAHDARACAGCLIGAVGCVVAEWLEEEV